VGDSDGVSWPSREVYFRSMATGVRPAYIKLLRCGWEQSNFGHERKDQGLGGGSDRVHSGLLNTDDRRSEAE
jgi:hypothetical protein